MTHLARLIAVVAAAACMLAFMASCGSGSSGPDSSGSTTVTPNSTQSPGGVTDTGGPQTTAQASLRLGEADSLFTVTLSSSGDIQQGISAVVTGDFNDDSVDDLLIGAPFASREGPDGTSAGEAYVVFGSPDLAGELDLADESPDLLIRGALGDDTAGFNVAAGDLNGDGIDDVIVAAPASHTLDNIRTDMGEIYVIFGRTDLGGVVDILEAEQDFTLIPAEGFARLGTSLAVGDLNGDGIDDLIGGAPFGGREPGTPPGGPRTTVGEVYVVYGSSDLSGQRRVFLDEEDVLLSGARELDRFGMSLAVADVNGDGRLDVVVGSPGFEAAGGEEDAGAVFVFYGPSAWPEQLATSDADLVIVGDGAKHRIGEGLQSADLNGDGAAEIITAARGAEGPGRRQDAGRIYVISGGGRSGNVDAAESSGIVYGPVSGGRLPLAMLVADADGDGALDIVASAGFTSRSDSGVTAAVYVVLGPRLAGAKDLGNDLAATIVLEAAGESDGTGTGLALGDLNGDGTPELIVAVAGVQTVGGGEATRPVIYALNLK